MSRVSTAAMFANSDSAFKPVASNIRGEYVELLGETYYCIRHYDSIPPFFMSIISSADHWLFIYSTGGLTAGRIDAESALFPYYTDDKIAENITNTGSVACLLVQRGDRATRWEPFAVQQVGMRTVTRNLYKNVTAEVWYRSLKESQQ